MKRLLILISVAVFFIVVLISTISCTPVLNNDELKTTPDDKSNS